MATFSNKKKGGLFFILISGNNTINPLSYFLHFFRTILMNIDSNIKIKRRFLVYLFCDFKDEG